MTEVETIIIDNGSDTTKAGFAGEDAPRAVFPTVVGRPRFTCLMGNTQKDVFVGDEAFWKKSYMQLKDTVERGIVRSWEDMESVWFHTFYNELRRVPEEHQCLLTEAPLTSKPDREKLVQIMFETFCVPALYVSIPELLSLYSYGRTSGIVLDSGDGITCAVPFYEGIGLPYATIKTELGGKDITDDLITKLRDRGIFLNSRRERGIVVEMKEKVCFCNEELNHVSSDFLTSTEFELPDGNKISPGNERFQSPELLFRPSLIGKDLDGVQDTLCKSMLRCPIDIRTDLYRNIVLSGGTTLFPGFIERLNSEMRAKTPPSLDINLIASRGRKNSAWVGGSVLGALASFQQVWIYKEEYDETGPSIVHMKC